MTLKNNNLDDLNNYSFLINCMGFFTVDVMAAMGLFAAAAYYTAETGAGFAAGSAGIALLPIVLVSLAVLWLASEILSDACCIALCCVSCVEGCGDEASDCLSAKNVHHHGGSNVHGHDPRIFGGHSSGGGRVINVGSYGGSTTHYNSNTY